MRISMYSSVNSMKQKVIRRIWAVLAVLIMVSMVMSLSLFGF